MASTINEARVIDTQETAKETEVSKELRFSRYCALDELPGLVFAIMTVAYIVLSLARLAP